MKVLIADDDPATLLLLRRRLAEWGYEVVEAKDGVAAWRILSQDDPPRIAILDWMMPHMDGIEVCKKLGETAGRAFVYTILLTSRSRNEDMVVGLESGAHNFLGKPINIMALRSHVAVGRRLVERWGGGAEVRLSGAPSNYVDAVIRTRLDDLARLGRGLSVMVVFLDRLDWVENVYGTATRDDIVRMVISAMASDPRAPDVVGRWGGQDILAVLPDGDPRALYDRASTLLRLIESSALELGADAIRTTASIGATLAQVSDTPQSLVARAVALMNQGRTSGGGCVAIDWPNGAPPLARPAAAHR